MADMIWRSGMVTAPDVATVKSYNLTLSSKVNDTDVTVNDTAKDYYDKIVTNYNNLKNYFEKLGDEFIASKKNVVGDKLKNKLQSLGKACKSQGQYCINRKNELSSLFEYANLEKRISELEAAIDSLQ